MKAHSPVHPLTHLASLFLLASLLLIPAQAIAWSGGGTADNPYIIATSADLARLAADVNGGDSCGGKYFKLTADIDLGGVSGDASTYWTPIGTLVSPDIRLFSGRFDGAGHEIKGLHIEAASADYQGLFGAIGTTSSGDIAEVRSLTVRGSVAGRSTVGLIAGLNVGKITSCAASGAVSGTGEYTGGIVGMNFGAVSSSVSRSAVSGINDVGGIVGINYGAVTSSVSHSTVRGMGACVGGIVGMNNAAGSATVSNCVSHGAVSGTGQSVGGIVGMNYDTVTNCASFSPVSGDSMNVGGIVGLSSGTITNCALECSSVNGWSYATGAIAGYNYDGGTVQNCGWLKDANHGSGTDKHIGGGGGTVTDVISYDVTGKVAVTCLPEPSRLEVKTGETGTIALVTYPAANRAANIASASASVTPSDIASAA